MSMSTQEGRCQVVRGSSNLGECCIKSEEEMYALASSVSAVSANGGP